jgi:hypothetical protein
VNFEIALNRRAVLSTTNKKFGNFVTDARSDPRCFNFGIESLLTEPVSRVPRYKLLLEQLLKYVPPNNEEYECLTKSYAKVTEIAIENNEAIRARENKEKIMEIMLTIDIKTRINLLDDENRKFIRSGNLERQCRYESILLVNTILIIIINTIKCIFNIGVQSKNLCFGCLVTNYYTENC